MTKHVLIMEDNVELALEWRDAFVLNENEVTLSYSGEDAIAHLDRTKFDLVVTDMFVPEKKGGLNVIGKILRMRFDAPPVIAVTGTRRHKDNKEDMNFFLKQVTSLGVSATLEKPFAPAELILLAHEIWDRKT